MLFRTAASPLFLLSYSDSPSHTHSLILTYILCERTLTGFRDKCCWIQAKATAGLRKSSKGVQKSRGSMTTLPSLTSPPVEPRAPSIHLNPWQQNKLHMDLPEWRPLQYEWAKQSWNELNRGLRYNRRETAWLSQLQWPWVRRKRNPAMTKRRSISAVFCR